LALNYAAFGIKPLNVGGNRALAVCAVVAATASCLQIACDKLIRFAEIIRIRCL